LKLTLPEAKIQQYWNINNAINNACRLAEQISLTKRSNQAHWPLEIL